MKNFTKKPLNKKQIPKNIKETEKTFVKRITGLDSKEQELLLKLYSEVLKDI